MQERYRRWVWIALGIGLVLLLVRVFQPSPVLVDIAEIRRGTLRVTVDDDGRTRVRERYTINAPIQGRLLRTPLDPGDPVRAGETIVAEFVPRDPDLLDARSRAEAQARLSRAEAALGQATARRKQAAGELDFADEELGRVRELFERRVQARDVLDQAERDAMRAREELRAAEFAIQVARFEAEVARASLREAGGGAGPAAEGDSEAAAVDDGRLRLRSPVDGTVLRVFEQSARALAAGTPILEVGNTGALEVVADYLSQDAVLVQPGMPVEVRGWSAERSGQETPALQAEVRRIEPAGFTKVSALGVEEQRVNILIDPVGDLEAWSALGDGFRVELRILLWEGEDVIVVPTGALFREGPDWAAFVVQEGRASLRLLELGRRNGLEAEVRAGVAAGDAVIEYPNELITDGTRVEAR